MSKFNRLFLLFMLPFMAIAANNAPIYLSFCPNGINITEFELEQTTASAETSWGNLTPQHSISTSNGCLHVYIGLNAKSSNEDLAILGKLYFTGDNGVKYQCYNVTISHGNDPLIANWKLYTNKTNNKYHNAISCRDLADNKDVVVSTDMTQERKKFGPPVITSADEAAAEKRRITSANETTAEKKFGAPTITATNDGL